MYFSLGQIVFDKAYTPDAFSHTDETSYTEHALINIKPRLQPTGNNLEEIELSVLLRAEIVNIPDTLLQLKTFKDTFEVLPLLMGTGQYIFDCVITKIEHTIITALPDGYPTAVSVSISLKEFVVADKLAQQQNAARKNAFAVGDITPSRIPPIPKATVQQISSKELAMTSSHSIIVDNLTRSYENNVSAQESISNKIEKNLNKMTDRLTKANDLLSQVQDPPYMDLFTSIADVREIIGSFSFPVTSISDLKFNNNILQSAVGTMKKNTTVLNNLVITRRG